MQTPKKTTPQKIPSVPLCLCASVVNILRASTALIVCGSLLLHSPARAEDPGRTTIGGTGPLKDELDAPTRASVQKGLAYLAKNINANGTINGGGGDSAAIMALAGLAFLANGSLPNDGPYGKEAQIILDFMLKNCQESGLIATQGYSQPMYGHGFATLYLAEVYGTTPRQDVGDKLHNAVRLIVNCQQYPDQPETPGGWRYQPLPNDSDISVTICQVMALRAARNAGIKVPNRTIDKAIQYVKRSQEPDGGFRYVLNGGGSAYPRSAAGVACLFYMRSGNDFSEEIKRGITYLKARLPGNGAGDAEGNFYYGNYYATQAMFMYGGDAWEAYWPAIRKTLLARQAPDGSWSGESGPVYGTAMSLIMLQIPNRLLPVLQK